MNTDVDQVLTHGARPPGGGPYQGAAIMISPRADISPLIPTAADPSGRRVLSRGAQRSRRDAGGALDRFRRTRTIPAAGSGNRHPSCPVLSHPARGFALESTPRTGFVSPAMTRRSHR